MSFDEEFEIVEDIEQGEKVRDVNAQKGEVLMALASSFSDKETLAKIQKVFLDLTPEQMKRFKSYLNNREYLTSKGGFEQKLMHEVVRLATTSKPKDDYLKKINVRYAENLKEIERLKEESGKTFDGDKVGEMLNKIEKLTKQNASLFARIRKYSNPEEKSK